MRTANEVLIYGRNMVHDALTSGRHISKLILSETIKEDDKVKKIIRLAQAAHIPFHRVNAKSLEDITESSASQGVAAYMQLPDEITLESLLKDKRDAFILLFSHLDYEQNLGAILRSAWAAGVDAVVVGGSGVHEVTPVVAKTSMGAAAYVPVISKSLFQAITILNKAAVKVIGVEVGLGEDYTQSNLRGATALVFGGEAAGLSEPLMKVCDSFIHIPIQENVASLNVSMAATLVCFEKTRQERTN